MPEHPEATNELREPNVNDLPSADSMSVADAMAWLEPDATARLALIERALIKRHLKDGNLVLKGIAAGEELPCDVPRAYFYAPYRIDVVSNELRPLMPTDDRPVYKMLTIEPFAMRVLAEQLIAERRHDLRMSLFEKVKLRELGPDEAETEATRLGVGPLNKDPDPVEFDPIKVARWSFAMTWAWLVWGRVDEVRHFWTEWRAKKSVWRLMTTPERQADGSTSPAWTMHLVPLTPHHGKWSDVELRADIEFCIPNRIRMPHERARSELWQALQSGKLDADGRTDETGRRVSIPAREFVDLDIVDRDAGGDVLEGGRVVYGQPTLDRAAVMALWPVIQAGGSASARSVTAPDQPEKVASRPRTGRKPGDGSYSRFDEPLLAEMQAHMDEGRAPSPEAAAKLVASKAYGGGTKESKVDRLAKRFRAQSQR